MLPSHYKIRKFRKGVNEWVDSHGLRIFPWRESNDSFQLFITEILLRRTKAAAVNRVWNDFFTRYKSLADIRDSTESELFEHLKSLGLASRRMEVLKKIANLVDSIPETEEELLVLPGVGKYIARTYLLMKNNKFGAIYDTNFRTVFSRYFEVEILKDLKRDKIIEQLSERVIPKRKTKLFVLGILDISALICKSTTPLCENCTLSTSCSYSKNKVKLTK